MTRLAGQQVLVVGSDPSGIAAAGLLRRRGAQVTQVEARFTLPPDSPKPDLVVVGAGASGSPDLAPLLSLGVPVIGERELAFQESLCLHVAVAGASGKRTTAHLIAHILRSSGRRVEIADAHDRPASSIADHTRDLDFLIHEVESRELDHLRYFRPVVGVLLNAPSDHPEAEGSWDDYLRRLARLFACQQPFDWVILQSEAFAHLQAVGAAPQGKTITFSAFSRQADLGLDRSLLVSRLEGWTGPLWDMNRGRLRGPHLAEDILAALAVGRVLRLSLDDMTHALESFVPESGTFEMLGEIDGVRFIDDSRSENLDALVKSLLGLAPNPPEQPFIWLIAGGDATGRQFYDVGPTLSPRVKHAFVFGEAAAAMRAAWSLFTPCTPTASLLDAARSAAAQAQRGDTILFSPACPASANTASGPTAGNVFRELVNARNVPEVPHAQDNPGDPQPGRTHDPNTHRTS